MAEQSFYPELIRLAKFIKDVIENSGLSLFAWQKKYADQEPNRIVYTTLRTICKAQNRPDTPTLKKLANILSASEGKEIAYGDLAALIEDPGKETDDEALRILAEIEGGEITAERINEAFKKLDIDDRLNITPDVLRQLADDIEFLLATQEERAALLIRREAFRRGMGVGLLVEKEAGLPQEMGELFAKGIVPRKFTIEDAGQLSGIIRDVNGEYGDEDFWMHFVNASVKRRSKR